MCQTGGVSLEHNSFSSIPVPIHCLTFGTDTEILLCLILEKRDAFFPTFLFYLREEIYNNDKSLQ